MSQSPRTDAIRLGTRASVLARTQSATVGDALTAVAGVPWQEVLIRTHGDDTTTSLNQPGRPGLFVSALRDALLGGDVDVIVHSFKDLPSAPEPGLALAAVPGRADARDALVSHERIGLDALRPGAVVGTSSPRRAAALARRRPDLDIRPIRGNVDSRIAKVRESGEYDATVLAVAGMTRIGRASEIDEILDWMLPAPAQGALAVECRADDAQMLAWLSHLDDPVSRIVTAAEREVLVGIDAACSTAIAGSAAYADGQLRLRADLAEDGRYATADVSAELDLDDRRAARALGLQAAAILMGANTDVRPVLLIRSEGNDADSRSLAELGLPAVSDPYVQIAARRGDEGPSRLAALLGEATQADGQAWLIATSPMAVPSWSSAVGEQALADAVSAAMRAGVRAAATGARTADTLRSIGFTDVLTPRSSSAQALVDELASLPPARALFPCGNLALRTLPDGLRERGWHVDEAVVYDTSPVEEPPASTLLLEQGAFAAVVLRSPSAVRAFVSFMPKPLQIKVVCAGETTAAAAREAGMAVDAVAQSPSSADVTRAVADVLGRIS